MIIKNEKKKHVFLHILFRFCFHSGSPVPFFLLNKITQQFDKDRRRKEKKGLVRKDAASISSLWVAAVGGALQM